MVVAELWLNNTRAEPHFRGGFSAVTVALVEVSSA